MATKAAAPKIRSEEMLRDGTLSNPTRAELDYAHEQYLAASRSRQLATIAEQEAAEAANLARSAESEWERIYSSVREASLLSPM